jgi:hypothetical protein
MSIRSAQQMERANRPHSFIRNSDHAHEVAREEGLTIEALLDKVENDATFRNKYNERMCEKERDYLINHYTAQLANILGKLYKNSKRWEERYPPTRGEKIEIERITGQLDGLKSENYKPYL